MRPRSGKICSVAIARRALMTQSELSSKHRNISQFSIRDVLVVILVVAVLLGGMRAFHGELGSGELCLAFVAGLSTLIASWFGLLRWPWLVGFVFAFVGTFLLVPIPATPSIHLALAGTISVVYAVAGCPVIIVKDSKRRLWPWMLGSVSCFAASALFTPPDPLSMLFVATPLSFGFILIALGWKKTQRCHDDPKVVDA